jgi:DNA segregation ATPase FtsK/SpoIIIE-like protein/predicted Ser/Thr protein kinase
MAMEKYGRYEVLRELGRGGMSTVFVAHDPRFDRDVALKVLPPGFLQDPSFRDRFDREAKIIAQLEHAAIVPVYDYGEDHGRPYLIMRLMTGGTLRDRIDRGPLPPAQVVTISRRICAALEKAHSRGIIHRDIKPPNILFDGEGAAYLADFGIARLAEGTQTVTAMGTPQYIAPEQVFGEPLDARTDIYQMGVVLFEMLTGRPPFEGDNSAALIYKHCHEPVPSARGVNPALTAIADAVVEKAMAKEKDGRYATASALADAIGRIPGERPARRATARPAARELPPPPVMEEVPFPQTEPWVPPEVARELWGKEAEPAPAVPPAEELEIPATEPWVPLEIVRPAEEVKPELAPTAPPAVEAERGPRVRSEGPALFLRRSPRIFPQVPVGKVAIPAPPDPPDKPSPSLLSYLTERKKYERAMEKRQVAYRRLLGETRRKLEGIRDQYGEALCGIDPAPADCLKRAEEIDRRLWERVPGHADFLGLRLGLGQRPFPVAVGLPPVDPARDPDPLLEEAREMGRSFTQLDGVPVSFPLASGGAGALVGPRAQTLNLARGLILQIATHHSPDEVKMVTLFPPSETRDWEWMRWLPHVWTDDRRGRFLACYQDAAGELLTGLYELLQARQGAREGEPGGEPGIPLPRFVFLLADPSLVQGKPIVPWLLQGGARAGAYPLFLVEEADAIPQGRLVVAEVEPAGARLILPGRPEPVMFSPDDTPCDLAERFARAVAPIRVEGPAAPTGIPERVALMDVLGVDRVEELDVLSRWRQSRPGETLAVPLGRKADAELVRLDIHEKGHGPHGLVAGAAGSGKKELLQSLLAALAVHYHPHELTFALLDSSDSGIAVPFRGLPHLIGAASGREAGRALKAIEAELERRRESLAQAGADDLAQYLEMARQEGGPPLPHLVVIISDLDELLNGAPGTVSELAELARAGREAGLHLILSTQNPAESLDDALRDMARFRLCLQVGRPEDSQAVLRAPDAADLTRPGQAILQVGDGEVTQGLQVAWGGAPCQRGGFVASDPHEVLEVALDGARQPLRLSTEPLRIETAATQLEAILAHIRQVADREGIQPLPGLSLTSAL